MITLRAEQVSAFKEIARRSFEDEMLIHLARFSPPLFKAVGEKQMLEAIRFGMGRAESYGFTSRGPVRLYLELMLLFGSDFDTDPQYPWARDSMMEQDSASQMERARLLHTQTMKYRKKVGGPDDVHTIVALRKIRTLAQQPPVQLSGDFTAAMHESIAKVYPLKAEYVGVEGLDALILEGLDAARSRDLSSDRGTALLIVLMLAFGHGCTADPLYPWIGQTLDGDPEADPETRVKRLERKALYWLKHVLGYFDSEKQA